MARVLQDFPKSTRRTKYPTDEWMDGQVYELVRGPENEGGDFDTEVQSMRGVLYTAGRRAGLSIKTRVYKNDDGHECIAVRFESRNGTGVRSYKRRGTRKSPKRQPVPA